MNCNLLEATSGSAACHTGHRGRNAASDSRGAGPDAYRTDSLVSGQSLLVHRKAVRQDQAFAQTLQWPADDEPARSQPRWRRGMDIGPARKVRSSAFISQCSWNGDRAMSANRREGTMMTALLTNIRQLPTLHAESTFVLCPTA